MATLEPEPFVAQMTSDGPLESWVGEIQRVTISVGDDGRSFELAGVLYDGRRWDAKVPMPPDWQLVRTAPGYRVVSERVK